MHNLLFRSALVLTDSAGLQEEAYFLEKPTLVLRERSERMDFLDTSKSKLFNPKDSSLGEEIEKAFMNTSPATDFLVREKLYGKTGASKQIVNLIMTTLKVGDFHGRCIHC